MDIIAAISTAMMPAGIAVLRVSGQGCIGITDKIFSGKKPLLEASSHSQHYGKILDHAEKVDDVLVSVMKGPNSYTGEDTVEISCHGSLLIQQRILGLLIENGARQANPGEFTMRAFLNGRMDLDQAESVMDIISSENELFLKKSMEHLSGNFSALLSNIREKLLYEIAYIESALDDPEHISLDGYSDRLLETVVHEKERIALLIDGYKTSTVIKNGIDCAIIGRTNVGKSSLLNALSRSDKAIVTDIPGTTRDAIEQRINIGGLTLNIFDTAGIRESDDKIEMMGVEKSKRLLEDCELILFVLDGSKPLEDADIIDLMTLERKNAIIIVNKSDLLPAFEIDEIKKYTDHRVIRISAKMLSGLDALGQAITEIFLKEENSLGNEVFSINERQLNHLKDSYNALDKVTDAANEGMTEEIFTVDLTDAYESLGKILGLNVEDDIINEIFSKFCIGK